MDGLLRFIGKGSNEKHEAGWAAVAEPTESETRRIFEETGKHLSPLGAWEMRGACAGPDEVMISSGEF